MKIGSRSNTYLEKLRDPRWQRRRLEILQRDKWTCRRCKNQEQTLHVHHRLYVRNAEPWDAPDDYLITLCSECHDRETELGPQARDRLLQTVQRLLLASDVDFLADVLSEAATGPYREKNGWFGLFVALHGVATDDDMEIIVSALMHSHLNRPASREARDRARQLVDAILSREEVTP